MYDLCNDSTFLFIARMFNWNDLYCEHMAESYSNYSDIDQALDAICTDYNLDRSAIILTGLPHVGESVLHTLLTQNVLDHLINIILKSSSQCVKSLLRVYPDRSRYMLTEVSPDVYNFVYDDHEHGFTATVATVTTKLNCMQRSWRKEQLRKHGDQYVGWVNLYDMFAIVYFTVKFKK